MKYRKNSESASIILIIACVIIFGMAAFALWVG
jgi:hypothetical protein